MIRLVFDTSGPGDRVTSKKWKKILVGHALVEESASLES
jgi:hypothetical protein